MNKINLALISSIFVSISGCAGSTANPIFNSSAEKAHIYAPGEARMLGLGSNYSRATGEVRYCASGMVQLVQARKQEALAAVAQACGGESNYSVIGELQADATGKFMGIDVQCVGNAGRAIYFKCSGENPTPTNYFK